MKKSQISFKIKNEKNYDSIRFVGGSISLKDLKNKIKEKLQDKNTGPSKDKDKDKNKDDILVIDELTQQLITDESTLIASDKKVLIQRVSLSQPPPSYRPVGVPKNDKPEFICKLCKLQFTNPTLTRCCGDTACESCLDKSIKQKSECPFCKKKALGSIKAGPNVAIQKLLAQPKIPGPPPQINQFPSSSYQTTTPSGDLKQQKFSEIEKYLIPGTKYFIIKSSNFENLELSIKHSEWATTKNNETKLNNAFSRSKNVILIFSVNKSSQFQGYARMESPSSNKINSWQGQECIRLGGTFKVAWLRVCNVNFSRVSNLKNRFNNHEPIKKSRDTQEIPEEIGLEICKMFEVPDKDNNYYPISDDRRKYMYFYGNGSNVGAPVPTSPREMQHMMEPISHDSEHSEAKTPTPRPQTDEEKSQSEVNYEPFEEKKKEEEKRVNLLDDLDLDSDEPVYFNTEAEEVMQKEEEPKPQESLMENLDIKEDQDQDLDFTEDNFMEHSISPRDQAVESTDQPVTTAEHQTTHDLLNEAESNHLHENGNGESLDDSRGDLEKLEEEEENPILSNFEEEHPNRSDLEEVHAEKRETRPKSPSPERFTEEDKKEKKPFKPQPEPFKQQPPAPQMPFDPYLARPQEPMARPPFMMDNRPPPPPSNMYPQAPQMRPGYPQGYPPNPYPNYQMGQMGQMGPYGGMGPPSMGPGGMNNPYYYYNYPPMWNPNNRPFPFDNKMKPGAQGGNEDNQSQASDDSDSSRKKEKKRSKKDRKKKRKSSSRSRDKESERDRERSRNRDKSRTKSKSKSRRK